MTISEREHLNRLHLDALAALGKDEPGRIEFMITDRWIPYTRANEILRRMDELLKEAKKHRITNLLIVGDSSNGKTSIIRKLERLHPPTDGIEEDALPIVSILAPITPDINALYDRILNSILIPFKKNDPLTKKEMEIKYHFGNLGVKILVIDEIHNILSGSVLRQKAFMNAIKNLSNDVISNK